LSSAEMMRCGKWKQLSPETVKLLALELQVLGAEAMDRDAFDAALNSAGGLVAGDAADGAVFCLGRDSKGATRQGAPAALKEDELAAIASWSPDKQAWCCTNQHVGCEVARTTHAPEGPGPGGGAGEPHEAYDCRQNLRHERAAWSADKKAWCCEKKGQACEHEHQENVALGGEACESPCLFQGHTASCRTRVAWLLNHGYAERADGCQEALGEVQRQCVDACGRCTPAGVHCPRAGAAGGADGPQVDGEDYDCDKQYWEWQSKWSDAKKRWCCKEQHRGCSG